MHMEQMFCWESNKLGQRKVKQLPSEIEKMDNEREEAGGGNDKYGKGIPGISFQAPMMMNF